MRKITRLRSGNKSRLYYIFGIVALCAFVSIGIGYSILTSTVRVDGTASITSTWKIVFTKAVENTMNEATTTSGPSITAGTTLDIGVELNKKGSQAIYDVTVQNQGTIDAVVKEIRLNDGEPTDLKVYISGLYKGFALKAGESKQFQVIAEWSASAPESSETEKNVNVSVDFEQETEDSEKPELSMPTYTVDYPNEVWTKEKNVTMTYPEGEDLLYQYSTDGGKTWLIAPSRVYVLKFTTEGTLYIRVSDGVSVLTTPLITIDKIDGTAPEVQVNGNDSEWTTSKTLTIHASDKESGLVTNPYSWDGGKTWTSVKEKEFTSNQTVNIWVKDNVGNINKQSITISKIDNQAPTNVTLKEGSITSSSISVTASATQTGGGIKGYQFSINNGTWSSEQTSATKTFTGLTKNTSYQVKVRVIAKNGKYTDSSNITVKTNNIEVPTYEVTDNGDSKTVTITYPGTKTENLVYQYSVDEGYEWITVNSGNTAQYTFHESGTIIARIQDKGNNNNTVTAKTLTVTVNPPLSLNVSYSNVTSSEAMITATISPADVSVSSYKFSWNGNSQTQSNNRMKVYGLTKNKSQTITVIATTSDGKQVTGSTSFYTMDIPTPTYKVTDNGDSKSVTITYPETKTDSWSYQYSIDNGNNWRTVSSGNTVQYTFTESGTIIARIRDFGNDKNTVTADPFNVAIDTPEELSLKLSYSDVTSSDATITATVSPSDVKISNYKFSWNGSSQSQSSNRMTVYGLTKNKYQTVNVVATASDGRQVSGSVSFYTKDIPTPTYKVTDNGDSKSVTITYPGTKTGNLEYQYTIDGGSSWRTVSGTEVQYTFFSNGSIRARVVDTGNSNNNVTAETLQITIGSSEQLSLSVSYSNVTSAGATLKATVNPTGTSIKNYQFKINNTTYGTQSSSTFVATGLTKNTMQRVTVTATTSTGKQVTGSTTFWTNNIPVPTYSSQTNSDGSKTVTIRYSGTKTDNLVYQYSIDNGYSWRTVYGNSTQYTFYSSGTIIARVQDTANSSNTVTASAYTVTISTEPTETPDPTPDPTPSGCEPISLVSTTSYTNSGSCASIKLVRVSLILNASINTKETISAFVMLNSYDIYAIKRDTVIQGGTRYDFDATSFLYGITVCPGGPIQELEFSIKRNNCSDITKKYYFGYDSSGNTVLYTTNKNDFY